LCYIRRPQKEFWLPGNSRPEKLRGRDEGKLYRMWADLRSATCFAKSLRGSQNTIRDGARGFGVRRLRAGDWNAKIKKLWGELIQGGRDE
jgi:hypothetical protein